MVEDVDACVLEVPIENAADTYRRALTFDTRHEATDASDDDVDRHTLCGSLVQLPDDLLVLQRIHLERDTGRLPRLGPLPLVLDELVEALPQRERRDEEMLEVGLLDLPGQKAEDAVEVVGDPLVTGEDPVIGVDAGGLFVEVARPDEAVATDAVAFAPDHHRHLGVHLETTHRVERADPRSLEAVGPPEVRLLVEAGLYLHEDRHSLPGLGSREEGVQDRGVARDPVHGQPYLFDIRVRGSLLQEPDDVVKGLIRRMDDLIPLANRREERWGAIQHRVRKGRPLGIREVVTPESREAHEVVEIVITSPQDHIRLGQTEDVLQAMHEDVRRTHVVQEAAGYTGRAVLQAVPDRFDQISVEFVVDMELGVPRQLDRVRATDFVARKDAVHVEADHVVDVDDLVPLVDRRQNDEAVRRLRHLHQCVVRTPARTRPVAAPELDDEVHGTVLEEGITLLTLQHDRADERSDVLIEIRPEEFVVPGSDRGLVDTPDPFGRELLEDPTDDRSVPLLLLEHDAVDIVQKAVRIDPELLHREPFGSSVVVADERPERRDAHAKVLVEVGREDPTEEETLQKGDRRVGRLLQYPRSEVEPARLAIEQREGARGVGHRGGSLVLGGPTVGAAARCGDRGSSRYGGIPPTVAQVGVRPTFTS